MGLSENPAAKNKQALNSLVNKRKAARVAIFKIGT
jgi:hypothetical protein